MKKITKVTKTATPPAPATKKAPAKAKPAPVVRKTTPPLASASKPAPKAAPSTVITVNLDVGFGNALYLRGSGPGLSWDKGVPMDCVSDDKWSLILAHTQPLVFKVLLNDLTWSAGDDFTAASGESVVIVPTF